MRLLLLISFSLLFLSACGKKNTQSSLSSTPSNKQGAVDSGGGNIFSSSNDQIESLFDEDNSNNIKSILKNVFEIIESQILLHNAPPEIREKLKELYGFKFGKGEYTIYRDILLTEYILKKNGGCPAHGQIGVADASTAIGLMASPICFDLQRLRLMPLQAIPFQIVALSVHEHSHHFGFNESEANRLQKHVLKVLNHSELRSIYMRQIQIAASIRDQSLEIVKQLNESPLKLCLMIGQIGEKILRLTDAKDRLTARFEVSLLAKMSDFDFSLNVNRFNKLDELIEANKTLQLYCLNQSGFEGLENEMNEIHSLATLLLSNLSND